MESSGPTPGPIAAPERPQPGPRAYVCRSPAPDHRRLECAGGPRPTASGSTRVGGRYRRAGDRPNVRWELAATTGRQLDFLSLGAAGTALLARSRRNCGNSGPNPASVSTGTWELPDSDNLRQLHLTQINALRAYHGLGVLTLLAGQAAQRHAVELAQGAYVSHWDRQGLSP